MIFNNKHIGIISIAVVIFAIFAFSHLRNAEQSTFEDVHNIDALFAHIDQMPINELRNKMKACTVDKTNCTIVFVEKQ